MYRFKNGCVLSLQPQIRTYIKHKIGQFKLSLPVIWLTSLFGTTLEAILIEWSCFLHLRPALQLLCLNCSVLQASESLVSNGKAAVQRSAEFLKEGNSLSRKHGGQFPAWTVLILE